MVEDPAYRRQLSVLIIGRDSSRARTLGALVDRLGATWSPLERIEQAAQSTDRETGAEIVLIMGTALPATSDGSSFSIREHFFENQILVGVLDTTSLDMPTRLGAELDMILYEPIGRADIERCLEAASSIRDATLEQTRERLRKLTALHQLATNAVTQSGTAGWLNQLVAAGRAILGPEAVGMWVPDPDHQHLRCIASSGLSDEYIYDAQQASTLLTKDYSSLSLDIDSTWLDPDDPPSRTTLVAPDAAKHAGFVRVAWLPVRDASRVYGHLSFYFRHPEDFEAYDLVLAGALASIVAATVRNYALQAEIHWSNRLYREQVETSPDAVVICHLDGTIERANFATTTITGRDRYEILGQPIFDLFSHSDELPWDEWLMLDYHRRAETVDMWVMRPDGRRRRVSCYTRKHQLPNGIAVDDTEDRIQLVLEDITVQDRRLLELELLHALTQYFSENRPIEDAYELVVSRMYEHFNYRLVSVGVVVEGFYLRPGAYRTHGEAKELPAYFDATMGVCGLAIRENRSILVKDVSEWAEYYSIDSGVRSELVSVMRVDGEPVGLIDIQTDASQPLDETDLKLADSVAAHLGLLLQQLSVHERLEQQAMTDPLTGIGNRRAFMDALTELVQDPEPPPAGLFLIELDHFKEINDRYGHLFGDEMLKQVSRRLNSVLRGGDLLARYGGDELAVIFRDMTSDQAVPIADRLRKVIADTPFQYEGQTAHLSVSIGIALFPIHGATTDELIGEADRAMYAAKLDGRNRVSGNFVNHSSHVTQEP